MSGREVNIPGVGPAVMYKRRGMRNIRISVSPSGKVRINLPKWAPYLAGERFAMRSSEWIQGQQSSRSYLVINDGDTVGRGASVKIERTSGSRTTTRVSSSSILVRSPLNPSSEAFQAKARQAAEKALRLQADIFLPERAAQLAQANGFSFGTISVKRLTSRWGSCSPAKNISLSLFLMQLPDELIEYVLLHELTHTEQMNHGPKFWQRLEQALPGARQIRKQLRSFQPHLSGRGKFDNIDKADLPLR